MHIQFLFGTETGTAEIVCEDLQAALGTDHTSAIASLEDVTPDNLDKSHLHVVVCSTFGSGDLPTTAEVFFDQIKGGAKDLTGVQFAIFGLGDRTFGDTFNQGSERLAEALVECKATQVGARGIADASAGDLPEDIAIPWLKGILNAQD
ncbi:MAG: flavodoxin domain-containing protein [Marinovum sp.]|nr:flavodoxin domain-containing protein [Marinovum sp.]